MDNKTIGRRIRERRIELGLTQEDLATKLTMAQNTLSRWETNERVIPAEDMPRLAKALYVPVTYFLAENPDESRDTDEITVEPIMDAVRIASSKGVITKEMVDETARYIRFRTDELARKRGVDQ